ncbi:MAG TPA: hypothetical protein VFG31_06625 [Conexibacter sp.]|nr:hypothetical protein [Conexibacter sp.]
MPSRSRWTMVEATEYMRSIPWYDARGRRIPTRAEWEQFPRWRRCRDLLLGWQPHKPLPLPWERER